ncbi:MAG: hypothetical protein KC503_34540 [Myxococcales bacterium]|nr:hypothetical protein [Myxococcales bacterium]
MFKKTMTLTIAALLISTAAYADRGHHQPQHKSTKHKVVLYKPAPKRIIIKRQAKPARFNGWQAKKAYSPRRAKPNHFNGWNVRKAPAPKRATLIKAKKLSYAKLHKPELHKKQKRFSKRGF